MPSTTKSAENFLYTFEPFWPVHLICCIFPLPTFSFANAETNTLKSSAPPYWQQKSSGTVMASPVLLSETVY